MMLIAIAGLSAICLAVVACTATGLDESGVVVRKEVQQLTDQEKADFVGAIKVLKGMPAPDNIPAADGSPVTNWYDWFVAKHLEVIICDPGLFETTGGYGHVGPTLLTWHRAFLAEFEAALTKAAGKPVAIPYWDWTDPDSTEVVFSEDFMGPAGNEDLGYAVTEGPFSADQWTVTVKGFTSTNPGQFDHLVRNFGSEASASELPSVEDVAQALLRPEYDSAPYTPAADADTSFRQYLDGGDGTGLTCSSDGIATSVGVQLDTIRMHGQVHVWVGGTDADGNSGSMKDCTTSPNDPVFWLHHANIDRIAEAWWSTHEYAYAPISGGLAGDNLGDALSGYPERTNGDMAVPTADLGYIYSALPTLSGQSELQVLPEATGEVLTGHH